MYLLLSAQRGICAARGAVAADLRYASMRVTPAGGLIVVDDFRTPHTPGVAAAFWPWIDGLRGPHSLVLSEYNRRLAEELRAHLADTSLRLW
jgi:hypothetical protein